MAEYKGEEFKLPDEKDASAEEKVEFEIEGETEIEVIDDTPEQDRGRTPMKEPPAEVTDEELEKYSLDVKKRIQHFSKGYHEERRAKEAALREREEALKVAKALAEENKKLQGSLGQGRKALMEQAKQNIDMDVESAKQKLKSAYEAGDADAFADAQEALAAAKYRAERYKELDDQSLQQPETNVQTAPQQQQQPQFSQNYVRWRQANPWFGSDGEMTGVAWAVHKKLEQEGVVALDSDEYYDRITSRVRQLFPDAFPSEKPAKKSVVAPATRSTAPKKIVLTQSAANIAKRLGVPLEVYARQVADDMRKQNV